MCNSALRNRYAASQMAALAPYIQHKRHDLEWQKINMRPRIVFLAGTAFWHVSAEISTGLKNVLWYVRRLIHNFKVVLCSDPNIDVASQKMASTT